MSSKWRWCDFRTPVECFGSSRWKLTRKRRRHCVPSCKLRHGSVPEMRFLHEAKVRLDLWRARFGITYRISKPDIAGINLFIFTYVMFMWHFAGESYVSSFRFLCWYHGLPKLRGNNRVEFLELTQTQSYTNHHIIACVESAWRQAFSRHQHRRMYHGAHISMRELWDAVTTNPFANFCWVFS